MFQLFAQGTPILQNLSSNPLLLLLLGFGGAVMLFSFMPQIGNFILGIFGKKIVDVVAPSEMIRGALQQRMKALSKEPGFDDPSTHAGKEFAAAAAAAANTNSAIPGGGILSGLMSNPMILIALVFGFFMVTGGGGCGGGGTGGCSGGGGGCSMMKPITTQPITTQPKGE